MNNPNHKQLGLLFFAQAALPGRRGREPAQPLHAASGGLYRSSLFPAPFSAAVSPLAQMVFPSGLMLAPAESSCIAPQLSFARLNTPKPGDQFACYLPLMLPSWCSNGAGSEWRGSAPPSACLAFGKSLLTHQAFSK